MKKIYLAIAISAILSSCVSKAPEVPTTNNDKNMTVETIMNRRSVRAYKPEQITKDELSTVIKSGINAPTALNQQNWEIRVVQNKELIEEINQGFIASLNEVPKEGSASKVKEPGFSVFHGAPTVIVVAVEKNTTYGLVNGSLFTQNVLLAAKSIDLGTCVIGSISKYLMTEEANELRQKLNISDNYQILLGISLGYPNESPDAKPRDESKVEYID